MSRVIHGIVRGRTIELENDPGVADGQKVEIIVRVPSPPSAAWGEGLRRCAGALADEWTEEDDAILEEIQRERKLDSRPEITE